MDPKFVCIIAFANENFEDTRLQTTGNKDQLQDMLERV
jgi:hypothetical protein